MNFMGSFLCFRTCSTETAAQKRAQIILCSYASKSIHQLCTLDVRAIQATPSPMDKNKRDLRSSLKRNTARQ
ncbi:hypothetical protein KFK09_010692 [Dendrobium nobile]|uniref:Uncharacterized protein n=1 Tax=Dendrobium nobile TaxID=94219 RepID=A0A8T3BAM2_DENNO|nr:hypothetical protein KFK09_010692 [Dendrobium nobile]